MRNDPIIITRSHVGQWASYIGGVALLIAVIGFMWQGGLTPIIGVALITAIIGIAVWASVTPD